MNFYEFINSYIFPLYIGFDRGDIKLVAIIITMCALYVPLHIIFMSFMLNNFRLHNLIAKINTIAKPLLCATLQAIAAISLYLFFSVSGVSILDSSFYPIIALYAIQFIFIIASSILYSYKDLNKKLSLAAGIIIFIFSIPLITTTLYTLSVFAFFSPIFAGSSFILLSFLVVFLFTLVQAISLRKEIYNYKKSKIYFFVLLFLSSFAEMFIIKHVLISLIETFGII